MWSECGEPGRGSKAGLRRIWGSGARGQEVLRRTQGWKTGSRSKFRAGMGLIASGASKTANDWFGAPWGPQGPGVRLSSGALDQRIAHTVSRIVGPLQYRTSRNQALRRSSATKNAVCVIPSLART